MTTASLIKQIWALPAGERAKIRDALEKHCNDEFYQSEGMTREEFSDTIEKARASKNCSIEETRQYLKKKRVEYKARAWN